MNIYTLCSESCARLQPGLALASLTALLISPLTGAEPAYESERMVVTASRVFQTIDDALNPVLQ